MRESRKYTGWVATYCHLDSTSLLLAVAKECFSAEVEWFRAGHIFDDAGSLCRWRGHTKVINVFSLNCKILKNLSNLYERHGRRMTVFLHVYCLSSFTHRPYKIEIKTNDFFFFFVT